MINIDYEITVNVVGESIEVKKRVQDCFFKLGLHFHAHSTDYITGDHVSAYTNKSTDGEVLQNIMWANDKNLLPTHTYNEEYNCLIPIIKPNILSDSGYLSALNSDELREIVSENVDKINSLSLQNDGIVELLKTRGLSVTTY